jgi:hypothetical protein
MSDHETELAAL